MNEEYPYGGGLGWSDFGTGWATAALNEDDYVGYRAAHPGSHTTTDPHEASCTNPVRPGPEVALSRYRAANQSGTGDAVLNWSTGAVVYRHSGGWDSPPANIRGIYRGCDSASTSIEWRVSNQFVCATGTGTWVVGTRTPNQVANQPFAFGPAS